MPLSVRSALVRISVTSRAQGADADHPRGAFGSCQLLRLLRRHGRVVPPEDVVPVVAQQGKLDAERDEPGFEAGNLGVRNRPDL
jgi:hypothetical protein